jgi:hypothetical protein
MSLLELVDNTRTDKNTEHSYLGLYEKLLQSRKHTAKNVLEIGIGIPEFHGGKNGGSIQLWHDYFPNATVYALEIMDIDRIYEGILNNPRIKVYPSTDGYNEEVFKKNFLDKNLKFDFILDDGPHTLETMKEFVRLYSQVLTDDGILVIEDIPDPNWVQELGDITPDHLKPYIFAYDLRPQKMRWDDIVFAIDKKGALQG